MIKGGGSLGTHKHYIAGHADRGPRFKHQTELELRREEKLKRRRKSLTASTVAEAMQQSPPK